MIVADDCFDTMMFETEGPEMNLNILILYTYEFASVTLVVFVPLAMYIVILTSMLDPQIF